MEGLEELNSTPAEVVAPVEETPAAPAPAASNGGAPALEDAPAQEDAFLDHYHSTTLDAPAAAPEPTTEDPRVAWRKKNSDALKAKDTKEAAEKKAFAEKAAAHLKKVAEARAKQLAARKDTNRTAQKTSPEAGVPDKGTTWEKVCALVNFSRAATASNHKDVTRLKNTLTSLKTVSVA